jgi:polyvinyl alcohol dehydrogenase (cytochrome)
MTPVWNTTVGPGGVLGGILGSTAFDGTRIYGTDTLNGQVFALGRDGSTQWNSLDSGALHLSPATTANHVLYTVDPAGFLTARDPATGLILTKLPLGGSSFGGVSAVGGAVYVAVGTGPPPEPAPQQDGSGAIIAFGDTSHSGP